MNTPGETWRVPVDGRSDTRVPDNRVLCGCYFFNTLQCFIFNSAPFTQYLHLVMQVFLVISGDKNHIY